MKEEHVAFVPDLIKFILDVLETYEKWDSYDDSTMVVFQMTICNMEGGDQLALASSL